MSRGDKIVLLGMLTKIPVGGVVWQTIHYLVGLRRLGYDPYYVEAHARTPTTLMRDETDDSSALAASFIAGVMRDFGFEDRWAFHALHADGRCYGLSHERLQRLYGSAAAIINLHGGTMPLPEHARTGRLVYLETDPVEVQVQLYEDDEEAIAFLDHHTTFFTFAENLGNQDCRLPVSQRFDFKPTRQPVVLDFWRRSSGGGRSRFTTVGNWKQTWRAIELDGESYSWSKHDEFLKFLDLPRRAGLTFELALSAYDDDDRRLLEGYGWKVRDAFDFSGDHNAYRDYIQRSRAEFTVAKDQNVRLRTGWFSDRSATYLAAGRPVVTQDTGFGNVLPTGEGLFAFSTMDESLAALEAIESDYERHSSAALEIAREYFAAEKVLGRLLDELGLDPPSKSRGWPASGPFPDDLDLTPISRWPTVLPPETVDRILELPLPVSAPAERKAPACLSIIVVTLDNLVFTRLCLESLLTSTARADCEVIVVDNGSAGDTRTYLRRLSAGDPRVRVLRNEENRGFAAATNQGAQAANGDVLVLLNNDTIVSPGSIDRLERHLDDRAIGLVGPRTNRSGNEAEVATVYRTYGELTAFAAQTGANSKLQDVRTLMMFCTAMRRDVYERVGPLDEQFGVGLFEDDDYAMRVRAEGYRVSLAADVFVHHFGQATVGTLAASGRYGPLFRENRRRFDEKWQTTWEPHSRSPDGEYIRLVREVREAIRTTVPPDALALVVSRGDDALLDVEGRRASHFPQTTEGVYLGFHPTDSAEAIAHLEALGHDGERYLVFPRTSIWWLEHYAELRHYLDRHWTQELDVASCVIFRQEAG
jgi:GT2 family glycosyltransferase